MTVKWGIIGCGDVVNRKTGSAFNLVEGSMLAAVMRRNKAKAREFAQKFGAKRYYDDIGAVLKDEEVNAVYIATPNYLHAEHTIKAAGYGKHILCEKPMGITVDECKNMIKACKKNRVKLMVAYYHRLLSHHQKAREIIEKGLLGRILMCKAQICGPGSHPDWGGGWFRDPKLSGGGTVMNVGCHIIDLLRFLIGEIMEVSAFCDVLSFDYLVEDIASLIIRFENGAHGVINVCYNVPVSESNVEIYGSKGMMLWQISLEGEIVLKVHTEKGLKEYEFRVDFASTRKPMIEDFIECLRMDTEPSISGLDGLRATQVVLAAYESSRKGESVKLRRS